MIITLKVNFMIGDVVMLRTNPTRRYVVKGLLVMNYSDTEVDGCVKYNIADATDDFYVWSEEIELIESYVKKTEK